MTCVCVTLCTELDLKASLDIKKVVDCIMKRLNNYVRNKKRQLVSIIKADHYDSGHSDLFGYIFECVKVDIGEVL